MEQAAGEIGAARTAAFDATDADALVAAVAVHLMANTAVTGATYEVDGGRQLNA